MRKFREKYIGDRAFYKMVLWIAVPIMIQNGITNFVGLLDNIMVGQLGTEMMSGVAIVNQILMVFQLAIFGMVSSASIFSAQFYGQGNMEGFRNTFRFKLIACLLLTVLCTALFVCKGDLLVDLFLSDNGTGDLRIAHEAGMNYLFVMLVGLIPYTITQIYASTLRETGETILPMIAGILAVFVNLALNYVLIFGHFGAPALGVAGAAIATVISRFVEVIVVVAWTHVHHGKYVFIRGMYRSLRVPMALVGQIFKKGFPLFINETMWSGGMAVLAQCYSMRGLDAVAAYNICSTVTNLFNVVFIALGSSIAIVVGQLLGSGQLEKAVDTDRKMIFFSVACCLGMGSLLFLLAPLFPEIYNTTPQVRHQATALMRVSACFMPLYAFYHASYFTMRSGGKTIVTFLFDSGYLWVICIPAAFVISRFTDVPMFELFLICQTLEMVKGVVGYVLLKKRVWVNNIVEEL